MDERISCTVDELAEAIAAEAPDLKWPLPSVLAMRIAVFLKADRLPEPVTDPDEDWIYE